MDKDAGFDFLEFRFPKFQFSTIKWILLSLALILLLFTAFFTVGPEEAGVIQRFGAYTRTVSPASTSSCPSELKR